MSVPGSVSGVFISYRRQDSQSAAGRLADSLERRFGKAQIFRDVETIQPGMDFVEAIEGALSSCSVMLAVIGRRWAGEAGDQNRLHLPNDWIRLEIAAALKRGIRVIPVLVEGAPPPADADLPEDLKPLARRQAHTVSDERWDFDVQQLAAALESVGVRPIPVPTPTPLPAKPQSSKLMKTLAWIGGIFVGLVVLGLVTQTNNRGLSSGTPTLGCGCWAYVMIGSTLPNPQCASGMEVVVACPAYCPTGGYQWRKQCT
jgi:hypothetical protein